MTALLDPFLSFAMSRLKVRNGASHQSSARHGLKTEPERFVVTTASTLQYAVFATSRLSVVHTLRVCALPQLGQTSFRWRGRTILAVNHLPPEPGQNVLHPS